MSKDEQRKRFLDRIDEPAKRWKFSMADVNERKLWNKYQDAYEDMIRHTSRSGRALVRRARRSQVVHAHGDCGRARAASFVRSILIFPRIKGKALKELQKARKALKAERETVRSPSDSF